MADVFVPHRTGVTALLPAIFWLIATCGCTIVYDDFLLVAESGEAAIYQLDRNGSVLAELNISLTGQRPIDVAYSPDDKRVYWTDISQHALHSSHLDGSDQKEVVSLTTTASPEGIAVDHQAGLVFYTDHAARLISVVQTDGTNKKTLFTSVLGPRAIRLDPSRRHIYWVDWKMNAIERANYDGSFRQTIYQANSSWFNSLALDLQERQIYWIDARNDVVQRKAMDGETEVETVVNATETTPTGSNSTNSHFYSLAVDNEFIYITDWSRKGILRARKFDGSEFTVLNDLFFIPSGIIVYRSNLHVSGQSSGCNSETNENGGCSNLCIPTRVDYVCSCPDNQRLMENEKTCLVDVIAVGPDLIWVEHDSMQTSHVMGRHGDPDTYLSQRRLGSPWSVRSPLWHWTSIDNDYRNNLLYLADREDNLIVTLSLNGNLSIDVIHFGTSAHVNGLAVDWLAGNVYWADSLFNWIMMAKAETRTKLTKTIVNTGLDEPHGLAVWPQKGLLLWTDWGIVDKLEVCTLAGEDRRTLVATDLNKPTGITVDYISERIFWCNADSVEMISVAGLGRTKLGTYPQLNLVSLTFFDHYIFAMSQGQAGNTSKLLIVNVDRPSQLYPRLLLNRKPYAVTMLSKDRQQYTKPPACDELGCEQLCVSATEGTAQCLCRDDYDLHTDRKSCVFNNQRFLGPSIIYALQDRICAVSTQNAMVALSNPDDNCFFVDGRYSFRAVDYHYASGYLYFSEVKQRVKSIRRAHMRNMTDNEAVVQGTGEVKGLVVDWTAGNLYWTDGDRGQIWVSRLDGALQKILIRGLARPHGIAIDQEMKKLYWAEQGVSSDQGSIKRANMDGTVITTLYVRADAQPSGLSLDPLSRRLYWADVKGAGIYYLSLDDVTDEGSVRLPALQDSTLYDVSVFQDFLVYTVSGANNQSGAQMLNLKSGSPVNTNLLHRQLSQAYDVIVFCEQNQASTFRGNSATSCIYDNGGCAQLCLQRPDGKTCACVDGMRLSDTDSTQCVPNEQLQDNFFLVADDYRGQIYQISANMSTSTVSTFLLPPGERPIALAYDFLENHVYWTDFNSGVIKRAFLNGSGVMTVLQGGIGSRIDGLAYDQESRILYYTDSGLGHIGIASPSGAYHTIVASRDLPSPRAVVLDPRNGYIYYTIRNTSNGRIERRDMSGENPTVLVSSSLSWPNGLAVDFEEDKLYWVDAHSESIGVATLDGHQRHLVYVDGRQSDPFGLAAQGDYVYWTDWKYSGIYRVAKAGAQHSSVFHADLFRGLNDLKFFNKSALRGPNVCSGLNNGGCSHFCLATPRGRMCACPYGYRIAHDEAKCEEVPTCPQTVANGRLDPVCNREINSVCRFYCNQGYMSVTMDTLECRQGLEWSRDVSKLCFESVCPSLPVPQHASVDAGCPLVGYPGVTCTHGCTAGYHAVWGDTQRRCTQDLVWTGSELKCSRNSCPALQTLNSTVHIAPRTCTSVPSPPGEYCYHSCPAGSIADRSTNVRICGLNGTWSGSEIHCVIGSSSFHTVSTSMPVLAEKTITLPIIIGIVLAAAALLTIVILVAVLVSRRKSKRAHYRNSPNLQDQGGSQLNNNPKEIHGENGRSPAYNAQSESVELDGKMGFTNISYDAFGDRADPNLYENSHNSTNEVIDGQKAENQTSFSNPMYSKEKQDVEESRHVERVLKGENVQPDLTRELSSA